MKPLISFIIPTKNEENTLSNVVNSIKKQSFDDYEIIVADAYSVDSTRDLAKDLGCKVVDGGRPDKGRNNGVIASNPNSKYFCFIDSDAALDSDKFIELALDEMNTRNLDVAGTLQKPMKENNGQFMYGLHTLMYEIANFTMRKKQYTLKPLMVSCMFSSRDAHESIGGFKPLEFGEDSRYAEDAINLGYNFGILENPGRVLISPRRITSEGLIPYLKKDLSFVLRRNRGDEVFQSERDVKGKYWTD